MPLIAWAREHGAWVHVDGAFGLWAAASAATARQVAGVGEADSAMNLTPQSSQRARGAEVWAALAFLGRDGMAGLVNRTCRLARRFADGMTQAGYDVLNEVVLNQVVVAFGDAPRTDAVIAAVQDGGTCWCGPTTWRGRRAMRVSVSCWNTTEDDVDRSIAAARGCAQR